MDALREIILDAGVGGHFDAALFASQRFSGTEKRGTGALAAMGFRHEPAFDITDRPLFVAAIRS